MEKYLFIANRFSLPFGDRQEREVRRIIQL
jgi:hypothetical protein